LVVSTSAAEPMPLSGAERSQRWRDKKKQEEEQKAARVRERKRLWAQTKREGERRQQQQTMASDDEDYEPPPPVETPVRLPPIAEMSPLHLQLWNMSRQRQSGVAQSSINGITTGMDRITTGMDRITGIYEKEDAKEEQFQQAILGMGAEDLESFV